MKRPLTDPKTECVNELAGRLVQIEDVLRSWSLARCTNLTLIARDPDDDNMIVVVTNEKGTLKAACDAALKNETRQEITLDEKGETSSEKNG